MTTDTIHDQTAYAEIEEEKEHWPPRYSLWREFCEYMGGAFWIHMGYVGAFLLIIAAFVVPLLIQRVQLGIL